MVLRTISLHFIFIILSTLSIAQKLVKNNYGSGKATFVSYYQKYISPVRGDNVCSMYPSCSQYAKIKFADNHNVTAYFDICDRLIRCGHDLNSYKPIVINEHKYAYDPVNDSNIVDYENPIRNPFLSDSEKALIYNLLNQANETLNQHKKDSLFYETAKLYFKNNEYDKYTSLYNLIIQQNSLSNDFRDTLTFIQAKIFFRKKDYLSSQMILMGIENGKKLRHEIEFLNGLNELNKQNWNNAETVFNKILSNSPYYKYASNLSTIHSDYDKLKFKKPWISALSSTIIPGSGYFYSGKAETAITALLINSLFIWTAVESFNDKRYGLFTTASLLGFGWYFGTIRGSYQACIKYNKKKKDNFIFNKTKSINF